MEINISFFIIGVLIGLISGFFPGLHANTMIALASSIIFPAGEFASFIIGLFPASLVSSYVPSIFFGIPNEDNASSVLPGQRMVLEGKGLDALKAILLGTIMTALLCVIFFLPSLSIYSFIYETIKDYVKWIVLGATIFLIIRSKNPMLAFVFIVLSGLLGYCAFNLELKDPFLPLFSGMFAMGAILNYSARPIPKQNDEHIDSLLIKWVAPGFLLGMFANLLPAIGSPSQVAAFATLIMPINTLAYLVTTSSIATSQTIFSLSTITSIGKSRIGATAVLSETINVSANMTSILVFILLSLAISSFMIYLIRKKISAFAGLDLSVFNKVLAAYLFAIILIIDGPLGAIVFALASILGMLVVKMEVERTSMMGSIIVPTLLILFRIF